MNTKMSILQARAALALALEHNHAWATWAMMPMLGRMCLACGRAGAHAPTCWAKKRDEELVQLNEAGVTEYTKAFYAIPREAAGLLARMNLQQIEEAVWPTCGPIGGITAPAVDANGHVVHTTTSGRMKWRISPMGEVEVGIYRPMQGCVASAVVSLGREVKIETNGHIGERHVDALARALMALADGEQVRESLKRVPYVQDEVLWYLDQGMDLAQARQRFIAAAREEFPPLTA